MISLTSRQRAATIAGAWALIILINLALLPRLQTPRVRAETVAPAVMEVTVRAAGTLKPGQDATLKAEFEGPVVRKLFAEGAKVRQGEPLVEIGRAKIQPQYLAKSNALQNAKNDLSKAVAELALQKTLFEKMAVAKFSVDEAARAVERARLDVELATTAFGVEEERWNRSVVRAPFDGTVTRDFLGQEKTVNANRELVTIGDLSSYSMEVQVDQLEIAQIRPGQQALVRLEALARPLRAAVTEVGGYSKGEKGSSGYPVRLSIAAEERLTALPGFTGQAIIVVGKTEPVFSVPTAALANRDGKTFAWVLDAGNRLRLRAVQTGRSNAERVEIVGGLATGERVCGAAEKSFREGLPVSAE